MTNGYAKLREISEKNDYSYDDMASMLEISKCFYWQLEHKKRRLYYDMAKRIAAIFNVKPDDLFYEDDLKESSK